MTEPLIRMHAFEPAILTAGEFERLTKEIWVRAVSDEPQMSDRILLRMLYDNSLRYFEVKHQKGEEPDPLVRAICDKLRTERAAAQERVRRNET